MTKQEAASLALVFLQPMAAAMRRTLKIYEVFEVSDGFLVTWDDPRSKTNPQYSLIGNTPVLVQWDGQARSTWPHEFEDELERRHGILYPHPLPPDQDRVRV